MSNREAITLCTETYDRAEPVNLGTHSEITIKELVSLIVELTDFQGEIVHPQTWPGMGLAGRAWVEREFNIHRLNDTLVSILRSGAS